MKPTTQSINNVLQDETLVTSFKSLADTNPDQSHVDTTMKDSFERFSMLRGLLIDAVNTGALDEISYNRRNAINTIVNNINQHRNNWQQLIAQTENLYDNVEIAGLFIHKLTQGDFRKEFKELTKVKQSYSSYINKLDTSKKQLDFINRKRSELQELIDAVDAAKVDIEESKTNSNSSLTDIEGVLENAKETLSSIKDLRKESETQKLGIDTFSENIDEQETKLKGLEERAKEVISQDEKVKKLIEDAEKALQLNSTLGISAAFSAQYEAASNKKLYQNWMRGAIGLLLLAVGLTIWAIGGWGINNPDSINTILGRVVAVGLSVAGAAFCARQYVKQKNIAEDYAYKAVLSKSIIAFADEIAGSDDDNGTQVGSYLKKVLDEIHQDPLRSRKEVSDTGLLSRKNLETIAKLVNAAKGNE